MKIAVIGYTGSGKSVLAAKLGKILGCPVLHLDKLQFEAGWKERKEAEGNRLCEQFLEENKERGWVIDGNYEKFCQKRRLLPVRIFKSSNVTCRVRIRQGSPDRM